MHSHAPVAASSGPGRLTVGSFSPGSVRVAPREGLVTGTTTPQTRIRCRETTQALSQVSTILDWLAEPTDVEYPRRGYAKEDC